MLVRPLMTNFKVTASADGAVSVCRTPPSIYKNSCPLIVSRVVVGLEGRSVFGQEPTLPSTPGLPASETKQAFLPTSLASLLAFEGPAARPPREIFHLFNITLNDRKGNLSLRTFHYKF